MHKFPSVLSHLPCQIVYWEHCWEREHRKAMESQSSPLASPAANPQIADVVHAFRLKHLPSAISEQFRTVFAPAAIRSVELRTIFAMERMPLSSTFNCQFRESKRVLALAHSICATAVGWLRRSCSDSAHSHKCWKQHLFFLKIKTSRVLIFFSKSSKMYRDFYDMLLSLQRDARNRNQNWDFFEEEDCAIAKGFLQGFARWRYFRSLVGHVSLTLVGTIFSRVQLVHVISHHIK